MFSSESAEALGARWNAIGREHAVRMSDLLAAFHEGRVRKFKFDSDPRDINMASRVADHVKRLNESGRWQDARKLFDPAHEPFIPLLDKFGENLPCAVILGPDEFLVRTGTSYKPGKTLHLTPSGARELPDILAFAISRDHNALLLVTVNGFTTSHDLSGPTIAHMPWPAGPPRQIDSLCVANGGRRVAFADEELGMWVGTASSSGPVWVEMRPAEASPTEPVEDKLWSDSMMHCALSPDGRAVATGSQCSDHCIDVIDVGGTVARAAVLRPRSEYPHNACFSDDGRIVALNACHFYSGESFVASVPDESQDENLDLSDKNAPTINGYLRVYASTWLPASTLGTEPGGFVLCGSGIMTCVTATGRVLFEQEFGSSAGAVDYSPKTQQLIVSSYSGFVHIYDIASLEQEGRVIGFKPRRERYRWVLWKGHDPFRW